MAKEEDKVQSESRQNPKKCEQHSTSAFQHIPTNTRPARKQRDQHREPKDLWRNTRMQSLRRKNGVDL
jgi:hypothetical protein